MARRGLIYRKPRLLAAALFLCCPAGMAAQATLPSQWELRLDAITEAPQAVHAGVGFTAPLGTYVRLGIVAGLGGSSEGASGRTDLVARFTLDPFREKRWAPYATGGVSARYGSESLVRLLITAGLEGPLRRGIAPAVELGVGGGVRVAVVLRQGIRGRR